MSKFKPQILPGGRKRSHLLAVCVASLCLAGLAAAGVPTIGERVQGGLIQDAEILAYGNSRSAVLVKLEGASASEVFVAAREAWATNNTQQLAGEELRRGAERVASPSALSAAAQLRERQLNLAERLAASFDAHVIFTLRYAGNAIAVNVDPAHIPAIRALPGVVSVTPIAPAELDAASSVDFTGVRTFWGTVAPDLARYGTGIGVGVVDTGIDHMHTAFGGPGGASYNLGVTTVEPYPTSGTPTAVNFPTPKVVWGYDFVGDAYNAGGTTDAQRIPVPDLNPMDGGTHGTSVASLIASFGVTNTGATYDGAFNRDLPDIASPTMRISPGYAPDAMLYSFRVFGNSGSTAVSSSALDASTAIYIWQADTSQQWNGSITTTVLNAAGQPTVVEYDLPQPPLSPRLEIVNLSLGSNNGDIEESSAIAAQSAADAGLLVVMSAGNAGDVLYVTGAPGVATGGISVAASLNNASTSGTANAPVNGAQPALDNFQILQVGAANFSTVSPSLALTDAVYANPNLADYRAPTPAGYTPVDPDRADLVTLRDPAGVDINLFTVESGSLVVSQNPEANNVYAGKVVLIDRGAVGFHQKALAAARAGASAAIIVNTASALGGMAENPNLPLVAIPSGMVLQAVGGDFTNGGGLNTGVNRPGVAARPGLQVSLSPSNAAIQDTMAVYSSRGPRRSDDGIKPDISAPAENVTTAFSGTGTNVRGFNGTSSAAPHTAGALALLRELRPGWSNYELKAALINRSANDIFVNPSSSSTTPPSGQTWGVSRHGVGRWDLSAYAGGGSDVILFAHDPSNPTNAWMDGVINVSFGVIDFVENGSVDRRVAIRNKGTTSQTFTLGFTEHTSTPGVSFSFPDGNSVTVGPGNPASIRIRMSIDHAAMRHARDPALRPFQFTGNTQPTSRRPRHFMNEASGFITLTPAAGSVPSHRLTVQAFPRKASRLAVGSPGISPGGISELTATGGYATGTNLNFVNADFDVLPQVVDVVSFAKAFELGYVGQPSSGLTQMQRAGDIQYVGAISDFTVRQAPLDPANSAVLVFGISAFGEFDTAVGGVGTEYQVEIDFNGDGVADRVMRQLTLGNGENPNYGSNMYVGTVGAPGSNFLTGWALNLGNTIYSNLYNNSVLLMAVNVAGANGTLGVTAETTALRYRVTGVHRGLPISQTPWVNYNLAAPGVTVPGQLEPSLFGPAVGAQNIDFAVSTNASNLAANGSTGVLMLYPMNAHGERAQVISTLGDSIFSDGFESP